MNNPILDLRDAAQFCGISQRRIAELLRTRLFPRPTILNAKAFFWQDELEEWKADNAPPAKAAAPARVAA